MKTKKARKLLRKAAKAGGIQVDSITNFFELKGSYDDGGDVQIVAYRADTGKIDTVSYYIDPDGDPLTRDDIYVHCYTKNAKKFLKAVAPEFNELSLGPGNIDDFASKIDGLPGVANGDKSTLVGLYGAEYIVQV